MGMPVNRRSQRLRGLAAMERPMAISYGLIAAVVVCGGIGYLLDRTLDTSPWLTVAGLVLGVMLGFYTLFRFMRKT